MMGYPLVAPSGASHESTTVSGMSTVAQALAHAVRSGLETHGDKARAARLNRRRRGPLTALGVTVPDIVRVVALTTSDPRQQPRDADTWAEAVRTLWTDEPTLESRYAAVALACRPRYRDFAGTPRSTGLYRDLIDDHPTIDTVDALATCCLPLPLEASPETEVPVLKSWAVVGSPWLRRAAIICQERRGVRTDGALLKAAVVANLFDRRPMIRDCLPHAIGVYVDALPSAASCVRRTLDSWRDELPRSLTEAIEATLPPCSSIDSDPAPLGESSLHAENTSTDPAPEPRATPDERE